MRQSIRRPMQAIACFATLYITLVPGTSAQETGATSSTYTVTELPTLGGTVGAAESINDKGWIAGFANLPGDRTEHAVLWINGTVSDLGTLGGPNSSATFPLNERGEVPGAAEPSSTPDPNGEDFCALSGYWPSDHLICLPFLWQKGVLCIPGTARRPQELAQSSPRKMRGRKWVLTEISEYWGQKQT